MLIQTAVYIFAIGKFVKNLLAFYFCIGYNRFNFIVTIVYLIYFARSMGLNSTKTAGAFCIDSSDLYLAVFF